MTEKAVRRAGRKGPRGGIHPWLAPAGGAIGFLGAVLGVGGGLFATPLLHYGSKLPLRRAVATSLVLVFATAFSATITELFHAQTSLSGPVLLWLVPSGLLGAQVGYFVSRRIDARGLRAIFVVLLLAAAARILFSERAEDPVAVDAIRVPWTLGLRIAAVGFGGGVVAPLLGIGGGLLVVPGLLLAVPDLGYLVARACSMGLATVTSVRSVWLCSRGGDIDLPRGGWLGSGALVGAVLGVSAVHHPGWAAAARTLLGILLVLVALRMAWDLRRAFASGSTGPGATVD